MFTIFAVSHMSRVLSAAAEEEKKPYISAFYGRNFWRLFWIDSCVKVGIIQRTNVWWDLMRGAVKMKAKSIFLLSALITFLPIAAHAGTITFGDWHGVAIGIHGTYHNGNVIAGSVDVLSSSGLAGIPSEKFEAYCVDLTQNFEGGTQSAGVDLMTNWSITTIGSGAKAAYLYNTYAKSASTDALRAALAIAIWEVLFDNNNNLANGSFYVDDVSIRDTAQGYLDDLGSNVGQAAWLRVPLPTQGQGVDPYPQDFMGPHTNVPEPSVLLFLGLGLGAIGLSTRKK